ncbi:MAG TPA: DUF3052 domain-containing protein [Acidimicrobiales bacterium]|nr:DUF3052 domain-containing protein [Acidimicrobiales bacterium]
MRYSIGMAGYSGTPLLTKLGIKDLATVALIGAPPGVIPDLPPQVTLKHQLRGSADVVVAFFTARAAFEGRIERLGQMVFPHGAVWIAWPKKASGRATDMTDHVVREVALPLGLVDNKVCAIDDVWTGVRLVWRRERRV